nr:TadE/TadG family type IV pilus assembly protein [Alsobacter ponti]
MRDDTTGAALVEAALLAPLLIVIGFATMDYATFVYQRHVMLTGVRDAARYLARTDCSGSGEATMILNAKNLAVTGQISGGTSRVQAWTIANVQVSGTSSNPCVAMAAYTTLRNGIPSLVTVQSTFSYTGLGFVTSLGLPIPAQISVQHTERVIGQ